MRFSGNPAASTLTGAEIVPITQGAADAKTTTQDIANRYSGTKGADLTSAATVTLANATGNVVHVTGTTAITSLGNASAGLERTVIFDGILTLTHNATSLILPTGANITTAAGDAARFICDTTNNWRCLSYTRKDGTSLSGTAFSGGSLSSALNEAKGANIASASTTDIAAATGNLVHITGTTTITALGTVQAGTRRVVIFDGALTLTHNATSLILPWAANITTAAGDAAVFVSEGSGNWQCIAYVRASFTNLMADLQGTGLDADACGLRGVPQNSQSANYTCVASDAGKHIVHPSGAGAGDTFTIPANASVAYEIGTAITFINMDSNAVSIAITTDTMNLSSAGTTGTRTLAQYGIATAVKVASTTWLISGSGLT